MFDVQGVVAIEDWNGILTIVHSNGARIITGITTEQCDMKNIETVAEFFGRYAEEIRHDF